MLRTLVGIEPLSGPRCDQRGNTHFPLVAMNTFAVATLAAGSVLEALDDPAMAGASDLATSPGNRSASCLLRAWSEG
jgi:hypothetical protein